MRFKDQYYFLSNFYYMPITTELGSFECVESAYQAYKCPERAAEFYEITPKMAQYLGQEVELRKDWLDVRVPIMRKLLKIKFSDEFLFKKLKAITEPIVFENYWGETFWGICKGEGENMLGKLLMEIRDGYQDK